MKRGAAFRGQPLLVLAAILFGWVGVRAATWDTPVTFTLQDSNFVQTVAQDDDEGHHVATGGLHFAKVTGPRSLLPTMAAPCYPVADGMAETAGRRASEPAETASPATVMRPSAYPVSLPVAGLYPQARTTEHALSGGLSMPGALAGLFQGPTSLERPETPSQAAMAGEPLLGAARPTAVPRRWSFDSWMLLREGDDIVTPATQGSYGRSQFGGVLRYAFMPESGHAPRAYLRTTRALAGPSQSEVALGVMARPVPDIPISVAGELRYYRYPQGVEWRPSVFAVSELPPVELPLGLRGELYLQGGYVGGRFATPFADGQLRIDRQVAQLGAFDLRAGGGTWGGAQEDANRVDIGPGMTLSFHQGRLNARLSADYRFRVAGDAAPESGPAITFSAGF